MKYIKTITNTMGSRVTNVVIMESPEFAASPSARKVKILDKKTPPKNPFHYTGFFPG